MLRNTFLNSGRFPSEADDKNQHRPLENTSEMNSRLEELHGKAWKMESSYLLFLFFCIFFCFCVQNKKEDSHIDSSQSMLLLNVH